MTNDDLPARKSVLGPDISPAQFSRALAALFILGLIIRAGFLIEHARSPSFAVLTLDQKYYDTAARMILNGQDLHQLRGLRPLLYPLFLAVWDAIGGAHGVDLTIMVQHALGIATGLLAALIGARVFHHRLAGVMSGLLYLLAPVPLYFEGELLIESSYTFLICVNLWLLLRALNAAGARAAGLWLGCGALTALIAQARSNILVFLAVYPLLAFWPWRPSRRTFSWLPLLGLAGAVAILIPWGFVNKIQSDHFQPLPSAGGVNLYMGNKRTADGMVPEQERRVTYGEEYQDSMEIWAREEYAAAQRAQGRTPADNPMAISSYWTHRALAEIKADPAAWLHLMAKKTWLMFWNEEIPNNKAFAFLRLEFFWLRILPVRWVVLLMLAPAGIWAAAKWGNRPGLFILLLYAALYAVVNIIFFVCDRYRYPIWPVMAVLAGGGLIVFWQAMRQGVWGRVIGILATALLMCGISLPNWFHARLPSFSRDYLFRSIAWYEKGNFPRALQDVNASLALDANEETARHHRGNILLALGQFRDASQQYEQILRTDTADGGVWNNEGVALQAMGQTNAALQAFYRATQCQPPSQSAFLGEAFLDIDLGRLVPAAQALQSATPNAATFALQSFLARQNGNLAEANTLEKKARSLDPAVVDWALSRVRGNPKVR